MDTVVSGSAPGTRVTATGHIVLQTSQARLLRDSDLLVALLDIGGTLELPQFFTVEFGLGWSSVVTAEGWIHHLRVDVVSALGGLECVHSVHLPTLLGVQAPRRVMLRVSLRILVFHAFGALSDLALALLRTLLEVVRDRLSVFFAQVILLGLFY